MHRLWFPMLTALAVVGFALTDGWALDGRYQRLTNDDLGGVRGTGQGVAQKKNEAGKVLFTNCADWNRGARTEKATCGPPDGAPLNGNCIICNSIAQYPLMDQESQVNPGFSQSGSQTCTGNVWVGICDASNTCNPSIELTQVSCATAVPIYEMQDGPPIDP